MKKILFFLAASLSMAAYSQKYIADYTIAKQEILRQIPVAYINTARNNLHVAYQHTSHGTHVSYGIFGLQDFKTGDNTLFGITNNNPTTGKLDFRDYALNNGQAPDLSVGETTFVQATREFLDNPANASINIIMWSWCDITNHQVSVNYLPGMTTLIGEYGVGGSKIGTGTGQRATPVTFIFMTGHAYTSNEGSGLPRDQAQLIIDYCNTNHQLCLDYYSIDSHDMDDQYWSDASDNATSDAYTVATSSTTGNFFADWQNTHTLGTDWYENKSAPGGSVIYGEHNTQHITANRKAYAMWWILARIAGWDGTFSSSYLTVSPASLAPTAAGGSSTITITANVAWTATSSATSWLTVSPGSGTNNGSITVTATANTGVARTANITVTGGGITRTIAVDQSASSSLTVSPASLAPTAAGGSSTITITANVAWTATSGATSWLTVSPGSGTNNGSITVTATANTGVARTANITVTGGGITRTIAVSQDAAASSSLTVSPASLAPTAAGGSNTITITANVAWTATSSATSWLTVSPGSGTNNGSITVTATANTGVARTANITVTGVGITRTIAVNQSAPSSLTVSPASLAPTAAGGSNTITITANVAWTATSSATSWLTVSPGSGTNNGSITATATANTGVARTANITVTGGGITRTIAVNQSAPSSLTVSPASLAPTAAGGSNTITITANVAWTATSSATSWLTVSPGSGTNNGSITATATANTGVARTANITVAGGGITRTIAVSQDAAVSSSLTVSPASLAPTAAGGSNTITVTANVAWTATSSAASWLTISPGSGTNNGSITATATANTGVARTANITVTGGVITRTITVTQDASAATILNDLDATDFIYPNPVKDKITIKLLSTNQPASISLYDINGKQLMIVKPTNSLTEIDMSNYAQGVYVLKITKSGQTIERKVLKQ